MTYLNLRDAGIEGRAAEDLLALLPSSCKALRFLDLSGEWRGVAASLPHAQW